MVPKTKPPKPKPNLAGFPAGTWRQSPFILPTMSPETKNGNSGSSLARKNGVGYSTISEIKKNSGAITNYASALDNEDESLYRKVMKMAENKDLYAAVYTWFMQLRSEGQPISGPLICEKALEMNEKMVAILI
ncbi:hypothetical protein LAZ67_5002735 [Cordylochernes scorpioides]|uniref:HTH CENPB-type domain-containing protein n=1 Tax=Cordylochernes scorpioides TaxID=51811 RepID=A0ABY6KJQ0_9ARAC|nr:hypothetical protein LAZ67_5002735 [Cordylochernes scorpioides]